MAATSETLLRTTVVDSAGQVLTVQSDSVFNLGVGNAAVDTEVVLTNGVFTALSVPTGSKAVRIRTSGAVSLTLKGVTGDVGVTISPATGAITDDLYLTLGTTPSIGILNGGASPVTARVIFL